MSKEKRVVFFEGKSWYHRTKELQDDLTTKYGKKGGFETPEEAEKSYWEYEKRYQKKQLHVRVCAGCGTYGIRSKCVSASRYDDAKRILCDKDGEF